jgi:hypothetical protein
LRAFSALLFLLPFVVALSIPRALVFIHALHLSFIPPSRLRAAVRMVAQFLEKEENMRGRKRRREEGMPAHNSPVFSVGMPRPTRHRGS